MSDQVLTWYGANRLVLASATAMPTSSTSGALAVPFSVLTALTSVRLGAAGIAEEGLMPYLAVKADRIAPLIAAVTGDVVHFSAPCILAAATSAVMPPP